MNWRVIWAIAQKDIVDSIKNRYILFSLVLPLGLALLFRLIFPSPSEPGQASLVVAVYDPAGSRLVAGLRDLPQVELLDVASDQELAAVVAERAVGGLAIPAGFDAAVEAGEQPELTVFLNLRRGGGELTAFRQLMEQQVWALVGQPSPARIRWVGAGTLPESQAEGGFRLDRYILILLLMLVLAMTGAFVVPTLLVEEKERHTLEALLVSPAGLGDMVVGKALTGLVYSILIAGILITLNGGWTGDRLVTALFVLLGALFMVAVGLLMGSLCRTTMEVNTWASIVALALTVPTWFTIMPMPAALEIILRLIPTHYLAQALEWTMAGGASFGQVGAPLAVMIGSAVFVLAAATWVLRREEK
ncbi:MAG: ABC transporter permease [Chloroflexi bacterium]|nr:ABC transporter permease [Chloroflexota bacterium]